MEEKETMRNLEWFIAQTTADMQKIDLDVADLQAKAEVLRGEQIELRKVLKKLTAVEVAEPEEPMLP